MKKQFAVLYDRNYYVDVLGFDLERADAYRVRLWAKDDLKVVGEVLPGSKLEILEERDGQYFVRAEDGHEGWIRKVQAERVEDYE